jgi:copper chaperone
MTKTYSVPEVSCGHCKMAIERAVGAMSGVNRVEVDVERKSVDVDFDETVATEEAILATMEEEGYRVAG